MCHSWKCQPISLLQSVFITACLLLPNHLFAQNIKVNDGEGIIVNASRTDSPIEDVIGHVSVISAKDIENSSATSLPELLTQINGLNIIQSGSEGGQTSFFMRGTESNHTAILINGQQQKVSLGSVSLQYIDLEQIERIEIIRGPQSSLYGSDAIGGIINIITKQNGLGSSVHIETGSHLSQLASISKSGERFHVGVSTKRTEGFDSLIPDTQNDKDGFELNTAVISYQHRWNPRASSAFLANVQQGKAEYDNVLYMADSTLPETHFWTHNLAIKNEFNINDKQKVSLKLGQSRYESKEYNDPYSIPPVGNFSIFTHDIVSIKSLSLIKPSLSLHFGGDFSRDTWKQKNNFNESLNNNALFTVAEIKKNKQLLNLSLREDDNEQFGKHQTYRASYQWKWRNAFSPYLSIGTGFKAPDFDELFSPWYAPNPNLKPELSLNRELGFKSSSDLGKIEVSLFKQNIKDFINAELIDPVNFTYQLQNLERVEINGMEFNHQLKIENLEFNSNISYTRAINTSNDSNLIRRPKRMANIQILYDFGKVGQGKLKANINLHAEGKRSDLDYETGSPVTLHGFLLTNLKADYQVNSASELYIKAGNIFDINYQVSDAYNTDGANFSLGAITRF